MANSGHVTATMRLTAGGLSVSHPITVPAGEVAAGEVIPALQELVNAVVSAAERRSVAGGGEISCRKGCGACCRQLVPVSRTEGERLLGVMAAMPEEKRRALEARFAAAEDALKLAGLAERQGAATADLSRAYFTLGIACPFLEDESCSIHAERPLICREYLVTSEPKLCAGPGQEGVKPVPVPKLSLAARGLQDEKDEWFPLALLMAWAARRPAEGLKRNGPEWITRFLKGISATPT
jgi:Fe-S-cluster containining protein